MTDLISEVKAALEVANNPDKYTMPSFLTNMSTLEENAMKVLPLLYERLETAERQRDEAVRALEWYENIENYKGAFQPTGFQVYIKPVEADKGELARTTLKHLKWESEW